MDELRKPILMNNWPWYLADWPAQPCLPALTAQCQADGPQTPPEQRFFNEHEIAVQTQANEPQALYEPLFQASVAQFKADGPQARPEQRFFHEQEVAVQLLNQS